jgi:hypothetical protein
MGGRAKPARRGRLMIARHRAAEADRGPGSPLPQQIGQQCGIAAATFDPSGKEFTGGQHHGKRG